MSNLDQDTEITLGGKPYKLRFTTLAIARFEEKVDKPFLTWFENQSAGGTPKYGDLLALVWAGLQYHHKNLNYEQLGDVLDPKELISSDFQVKIVEAMSKVFPQIKEQDAEEDPADEGKPQEKKDQD